MKAAKLLRKHRHFADPRGDPPTYDARVVDYLRATHGQPHRELNLPDDDWLARYQKELHDTDP